VIGTLLRRIRAVPPKKQSDQAIAWPLATNFISRLSYFDAVGNGTGVSESVRR
jgi:hypothetical protein